MKTARPAVDGPGQLSRQAPRNGANIRLLAADLDGTLLGDPAAARRFSECWGRLSQGRRPLLVYNSSRTIQDMLSLPVRRDLPRPDIMIGALGTQFHDLIYGLRAEFDARFAQPWDQARAVEVVETIPGVSRQPREFQDARKASWFWNGAAPEEVDALAARLREAGVPSTVVYSCGRYLDLLPPPGGKGAALEWLCQRLNIPLGRVLVAGDSAADASMFRLPGVHAILVRNALPELAEAARPESTYRASAPGPDGIVEGLRQFGIGAE